MSIQSSYDVIVVGGGHAGTEVTLANGYAWEKPILNEISAPQKTEVGDKQSALLVLWDHD